MTLDEFAVLSGLRAAEHNGLATADDIQIGGRPQFIGYRLRSLAQRGLVRSPGMQHGGKRQWYVTADGAKVLDA